MDKKKNQKWWYCYEIQYLNINLALSILFDYFVIFICLLSILFSLFIYMKYDIIHIYKKEYKKYYFDKSK